MSDWPIGAEAKDVARDEQVIEHHSGEWRGELWMFSLSTPKARRDYWCHGCGEKIERGARHVSFVTAGQEGPGMERWRLHGECYLSGDAMFDVTRPAWRWVGPEPRQPGAGRTSKRRRRA